MICPNCNEQFVSFLFFRGGFHICDRQIFYSDGRILSFIPLKGVARDRPNQLSRLSFHRMHRLSRQGTLRLWHRPDLSLVRSSD